MIGEKDARVTVADFNHALKPLISDTDYDRFGGVEVSLR